MTTESTATPKRKLIDHFYNLLTEIYKLKRIIFKFISEEKHHIYSVLYLNIKILDLLDLLIGSSQLLGQMPVMMVNLNCIFGFFQELM